MNEIDCSIWQILIFINLIPVFARNLDNPEYIYKRQVIPEYNIDVVAIADWKLFDHWVGISEGSTTPEKEANAVSNIRRYISVVFDGVNMRYTNVADFRVKVRLVDIVIFQDKSQEDVTPIESFTGMVNANSTLYRLKNYAKTHQLQDNDHVMLFTGHDVFSTDNGALFKYTTGLAFVGTMCDGVEPSMSVVEDRGAFQSVHTVAHELAHSLNATHDGVQNACSLGARYIMAGSPSDITDTTKANPWYFSACSMQEMSSFIAEKMKTSSGRTCLQYNLAQAPGLPDVSNVKAGQLYDPDTQCRHMYGSSSYYCRGGVFGGVEDICYSMFCRTGLNNDNITCNQHHAADFTSCGDKKWCINGQCTSASEAPTKHAGCVHGDEPSRHINRQSCSELLRDGSYFCYEQITQDYCCGTCRDRDTGVEGCEYGDRLPGCDSSYCHITFPNGTVNDVTCCGTCNYAPNVNTCVDSATTPGIDCSTVQGDNCYNWTVAFHCCATCSNLRKVENTGCEYGDKIRDCASFTSNGRHCDADEKLKSVCCETCKEEEISGSGHGTPHGAILITISFVLLFLILL